MSAAPVARPMARLSLALAVTLALAACSSTASPSASGTPEPSGSPLPADAVPLLRVRSEGGFINPASTMAALPMVVVYTDGRILMAGSPSADNPNPLVVPVSLRTVGAAGAAAIAAAIHAVGLDTASSADPGVPGDSGVDVFEVLADGVTVSTRFAGNGPGGPGLPGGGENPERTAALDLLGKLLDPAETWGAASAPNTVYQPIAYRVFVAPGAPAGDGGASQPPSVAWPLATSLAEFGTPAVPDFGIAGLRSGVLHGADVAAAAPVLEAASATTAFTSGGQSYTLSVRALLPDEVGA
jgi:hypothetical protein